MQRATAEQLTAFSTPNALPVEGDHRLEQRNWVVRLSSAPGRSISIDELSSLAGTAAVDATGRAREERQLQLAAVQPIVQLSLLGEKHIVVNIKTVRMQDDDAHSWMVAASAALRALENRLALEDVQGIPRRYWRMLLG